MNPLKLIVCASLLVVSGASVAEDASKKKIWSCKKEYTKENILWLVEWGDKSYIKVFDERIPARYSMDGLEKRWDWGLDSDNTYDYAITMSPDKRAKYYDFSISSDGTAQSRETYRCE